MRDLHINVTNKVATYSARDGFIVCENAGQYRVVFAFDAEWDTYDKKVARFIWNGHYMNVDFTGTTCLVPPITAAERVLVGVYAGDLCTTTPAVVECVPSILSAPGSEVDGSPVVNGDSCFFRYSAYADGTDFTAAWVEGQDYIGFATGQSAPTDKSGYTWSLFRGENVNVTQGKGDSTTEAMSQASTTQELNALDYKIDLLNTLTEEKLDDRANAIKGKASGAIAAMANVSPVSHNVKVGLRSKNLLPYPFSTKTTTVRGVTFTDNGDGSVTINGTAEAAVEFVLYSGNMPVNGSYTISGVTGGSGSSYYIQPFTTDKAHGGLTNGSRTYEWTNTVLTHVGLNVAEGASLDNVVVRPMLELGTEATAYTPYVAPTESVTVRSRGKNLAHPALYAGATNGYTFTPDGDGGLVVGGSATEEKGTLIDIALRDSTNAVMRVPLKANTPYTLTVYKDGVKFSAIGAKCVTAGGTELWGFTQAYEQDRMLEKVYLQFTPEAGDTSWCGTYTVQVEEGAEATPYTPHVGASLTAAVGAEGIRLTSISPIMGIYTENIGVVVDAEYNVDTAVAVSSLEARIAALEAKLA